MNVTVWSNAAAVPKQPSPERTASKPGRRLLWSWQPPDGTSCDSPPFPERRPKPRRRPAAPVAIAAAAEQTVVVDDSLPDRIAHLLIDPTAWISAASVHDIDDQPSARNFLSAIWTVLAGTPPDEVQLDKIRIAVVRSPGVGMRVHLERDQTFTITISRGLLFVYDAYSRAWTAAHHPSFAVDLPEDAARDPRNAVLDMAVEFRDTGVVRPRLVPLSSDGVERAGAHMAVGFVFLLSHEIAHVTAGHLHAAGTGPRTCLDVEASHAREFEADRVVAEFMAANPPSVTKPGQSLRILFDMLQLLAFGTAAATHPHPIERLLAVLGTLDPAARDAVVQEMLARRGTWLTAQK